MQKICFSFFKFKTRHLYFGNEKIETLFHSDFRWGELRKSVPILKLGWRGIIHRAFGTILFSFPDNKPSLEEVLYVPSNNKLYVCVNLRSQEKNPVPPSQEPRFHIINSIIFNFCSTVKKINR
jgi:hypothetical protein